MRTYVATNTDMVLDYLAEHGGVAEVPPGRSLLRSLAEELDLTRTELTAAISELEADGVVMREAQDRRTFRLTTTDPASRAEASGPVKAHTPAAWEPDSAPTEPATPAEPTEAATPAPASAPPWAVTATEQTVEPTSAGKSRFGRRDKGEKKPKELKAMSGVVFEIRQMENRSFEGIGGQPLSRHKTSKEAFKELKHLTRARSGGKFTPRVVVRIDPDGTEDIAIPFDETTWPDHFHHTLSGGRR
ncbi:MAG: hypothetical protein ABIW46_01040 [Acidimicrobiales bacterium]